MYKKYHNVPATLKETFGAAKLKMGFVSRNCIFRVCQLILTLIQELRKITENSINNTSQFVNKISQITINNDEKLANLDIQDMYTSISVTRAVDVVINEIINRKNLKIHH
ncbi:unnamed protein product [Rotaria socialis]|uniref:Uncharacterized protein n=1 Tax=Rotaria socialis TaxID=392032 RepID=A0A818C2H3_9BILA|nr:unnamed protein product [Rotaria socialis]